MLLRADDLFRFHQSQDQITFQIHYECAKMRDNREEAGNRNRAFQLAPALIQSREAVPEKKYCYPPNYRSFQRSMAPLGSFESAPPRHRRVFQRIRSKKNEKRGDREARFSQKSRTNSIRSSEGNRHNSNQPRGNLLDFRLASSQESEPSDKNMTV